MTKQQLPPYSYADSRDSISVKSLTSLEIETQNPTAAIPLRESYFQQLFLVKPYLR